MTDETKENTSLSEAEQEARESAKGQSNRKTIADLEEMLEGLELTYVQVGGKYRAAFEATHGHTYASDPYSLRELIIWLDGYNFSTRDNS